MEDAAKLHVTAAEAAELITKLKEKVDPQGLIPWDQAQPGTGPTLIPVSPSSEAAPDHQDPQDDHQTCPDVDTKEPAASATPTHPPPVAAERRPLKGGDSPGQYPDGHGDQGHPGRSASYGNPFIYGYAGQHGYSEIAVPPREHGGAPCRLEEESSSQGAAFGGFGGSSGIQSFLGFKQGGRASMAGMGGASRYAREESCESSSIYGGQEAEGDDGGVDPFRPRERTINILKDLANEDRLWEDVLLGGWECLSDINELYQDYCGEDKTADTPEDERSTFMSFFNDTRNSLVSTSILAHLILGVSRDVMEVRREVRNLGQHLGKIESMVAAGDRGIKTCMTQVSGLSEGISRCLSKEKMSTVSTTRRDPRDPFAPAHLTGHAESVVNTVEAASKLDPGQFGIGQRVVLKNLTKVKRSIVSSHLPEQDKSALIATIRKCGTEAEVEKVHNAFLEMAGKLQRPARR